MRLPAPPLLVITDRHQARRPLEDIAASVFRAGGRWLSLREKDLAPAVRRELLARLVTLGRGFGARVMVHEDVEAAAAAGAGGVHLPEGVSPAAARRCLGPEALIGASVHTGAELGATAAEGLLDYVTLSPIFPSASKPGYGPPLGLAHLKAASGGGIPIVALGGIDACTLGTAIAAGAAGIAVMGVVMRADDPAAVTAGLLKTLDDSLAASGQAPHSTATWRARPSKGGEP